ncbi:MAG: nitrous oxide reductase accessory protein NosL [Pseudomonadota bacterium]
MIVQGTTPGSKDMQKLVAANLSFIVVALAAFLVFVNAAAAEEKVSLPDGSSFDSKINCPVCNMPPGSNPQGAAAVVFKDGKVVGLDGTRHMFIYLRSPEKYGIKPEEVREVFVPEWGSKKFLSAKSAFFMLGGDVKGNMGWEAIAFSKKEDAEKFKVDHVGIKVATFDEVRLSDVQAKKRLKMEGGHGH